jgi:phage FluMu protein gp41
MIANHVGALYPDRFNSIALGKVQAASVGSTGNAVVTIPIIQGSSYIVRQITVANASGDISSANVAVLTTDDGNTSNSVASATVLANVSSTTTYQDLTLASNTATTVYSAGALYLLVNTAVASETCDITVFGDVVTL